MNIVYFATFEFDCDLLQHLLRFFMIHPGAVHQRWARPDYKVMDIFFEWNYGSDQLHRYLYGEGSSPRICPVKPKIAEESEIPNKKTNSQRNWKPNIGWSSVGV